MHEPAVVAGGIPAPGRVKATGRAHLHPGENPHRLLVQGQAGGRALLRHLLEQPAVAQVLAEGEPARRIGSKDGRNRCAAGLQVAANALEGARLGQAVRVVRRRQHGEQGHPVRAAQTEKTAGRTVRYQRRHRHRGRVPVLPVPVEQLPGPGDQFGFVHSSVPR